MLAGMSTPRLPVAVAATGDLGIVDRLHELGGIEIPRHGSIASQAGGTRLDAFVDANAVRVGAGIEAA